jgi:hypothetical protein
LRPIVRNIQNNDLYFYNGENNFTNLRTLKSGNVPDGVARKTFKVNLDATEIINEYPFVGEMINILNLKFQNKED